MTTKCTKGCPCIMGPLQKDDGIVVPPVILSKKEVDEFDKMKHIAKATQSWIGEVYNEGCKAIDEAIQTYKDFCSLRDDMEGTIDDCKENE